MKSAEEIVNQTLFLNHTVGFQKSSIIEVMKQYGTQIAKQALEDAANNATLYVETPINGTEFKELTEDLGYENDPFIQKTTVFKQSILDTEIKTP